MLNIILVSENERERNILTIALGQRGINVLHSESKYKNYVYVMQFMPDIIIMELPHYCIEQLNFAERIRSFKKTRGIPIIGYGEATSQSIVNGMIKNGISTYIDRPLKFSVLLKIIERYLKTLNKSLEQKPALTDIEQDIALLLNSDAPYMEKIDVMVSHVSKLVAFPFTVAKVLHITQDKQTGAQELAKAVNADPYMATYLLKVSNTVFFASANRRISSIKDAIVRIGFNETKRLVLGMSVINLFEITNKNSGFDRIDFWYHSLATAIIAERIAKNFGDVNLDEAFLAGLLHDLGIMLLDDFFPSVFDNILRATSKEAGLFYEYEKKILNVTHLDMIAQLFPKWRIPQNITDSILIQYKVPEMSGPIDTPDKKMAVCIAVGNATAKLLNIGKECDGFIAPFDDSVFNDSKLTVGLLSAIIQSVQQQVGYFSNFLNMEKREYRCDCPAGVNLNEITVGICNPDNSVFLPLMLFFKMREIKYEMILTNENIEAYDGKYHVIMCWATISPVDPALIERLQHVRRKAEPDQDAYINQEQYTPLIVMAPQSGDAQEAAPDGYLAFDNKLDYRMLESKLFELLKPVFAAQMKQ